MEGISWSGFQAVYLIIIVGGLTAFVAVLGWASIYSGGKKK